MKVLFVGPTLAGEWACPAQIVQRGPAAQGDVTQSVLKGASAIGIVDGLFEEVAAVWHKEILYALSQGVRVFGAASMGALRAAECDSFGMIGVGQIYRRYATGDLDDDAAVAQLHAPGDFGFVPLSEALVNVEATIDGLLRSASITSAEGSALLAAASSLNFRDRTYARVVHTAGIPAPRRGPVLNAISAARVDLKRADAEELVDVLARAPDTREHPPPWEFSMTATFRATLDRLSGPNRKPSHPSVPSPNPERERSGEGAPA